MAFRLLPYRHGDFLRERVYPDGENVGVGVVVLQCAKAQYLPPEESISRLKIYRLTEFIGRWSMIDIFVVAILVALVQLQNLMAIYPGPAALSFAAVVIFTMLSAMIFDSRLLWQLPQSEVQEPMTNNLTEKAKYE